MICEELFYKFEEEINKKSSEGFSVSTIQPTINKNDVISIMMERYILKKEK